MIQRFDAFVSGITSCYKYIQRIKSLEMTEFGLKGTHVMCMYYLRQNPGGLTASQLCGLCAADTAALSRTVAELTSRGYITTLSENELEALAEEFMSDPVFQTFVEMVEELFGSNVEKFPDITE